MRPEIGTVVDIGEHVDGQQRCVDPAAACDAVEDHETQARKADQCSCYCDPETSG